MDIKRIIGAGWKLIGDKDYRFTILANQGFYDAMPDERYLKRQFKAAMGRKLNLDNPVTFNEKLQWLKLFNRRPEYTTYVDKYAVRDYIAETMGESYLIPLIGAWDDPEQIDFDVLPDQFVLKCNHNSGKGMCICKDKAKLDIPKVKRMLKKGFEQDYYLTGREWPYKNVKRKILAEQYIVDSSNTLVDYKFFCFDGVVDSVMVCVERETGNPKFYFFDEGWNLKRYNVRGKAAPAGFTLPKPENMDEMFQWARLLSQGMPFVRVDLYNVDGRIYFGELTFFPDSGFDRNLLPETDAAWGELLKLPREK